MTRLFISPQTKNKKLKPVATRVSPTVASSKYLSQTGPALVTQHFTRHLNKMKWLSYIT